MIQFSDRNSFQKNYFSKAPKKEISNIFTGYQIWILIIEMHKLLQQQAEDHAEENFEFSGIPMTS